MLINEAIRRDIFEKTVAHLNVDPKVLKAWVLAADLDETVPHGNWILQALQRGMPFDEVTRNRLNLLLRFLRQYRRSVVDAGFSTNVYDYKTYDDLRKMINSFRKNAYDFDPKDLSGVTEIFSREPYAVYEVSDILSLGKMGLGTKWCTREDWDTSRSNRRSYLNQGGGRVFIITKFNTPYVQFQPDLSQVKYWENDKEYKRGDLGFLFKAVMERLDLSRESAVERLLKQLDAKDRNPVIKKLVENKSDITSILRLVYSLPEELGIDAAKFYERLADYIRIAINGMGNGIPVIKEYVSRLNPSDRIQLAREMYQILKPKMDLQTLVTKFNFCNLPIFEIEPNILLDAIRVVHARLDGKDPARVSVNVYYPLKNLLQGKFDEERWPHVEEYLLQNDDIVLLKLYIRYLLQFRLRAEPIEQQMLKIDDDPELLIAYAINCIQAPWKEAEHIFLGNDAVSKQMLEAYHELSDDTNEVKDDTPEIRAIIERYKKSRPAELERTPQPTPYHNDAARRLYEMARWIGPIPAFEQAMREINDTKLIADYKRNVLLEPDDEIL